MCDELSCDPREAGLKGSVRHLAQRATLLQPQVCWVVTGSGGHVGLSHSGTGTLVKVTASLSDTVVSLSPGSPPRALLSTHCASMLKDPFCTCTESA